MEQNTTAGQAGLRLGPAIGDGIFLAEVDGVFPPGRGVPAQGRTPANGCAPWPMDGEVRIRAASRAFLGLADLLARASPPSASMVSPSGGCIDLTVVANVGEVGALFEFTDTAVSRVVELRRDMVELANQYQTTGRWLSETVAAAWAIVQSAQPAPKYASVLDDGHRVIAKDWLAADMNLLIATLLRRAVWPVDGLDLSPAAVRADLVGVRHCESVFQIVAEMLDRAAALACESIVFVDEIDGCLRRFRQQVVTVVGLAQSAEETLQSAAPPWPSR